VAYQNTSGVQQKCVSLECIYTSLECIYISLECIYISLECIYISLEFIYTSLECIYTSLEYNWQHKPVLPAAAWPLSQTTNTSPYTGGCQRKALGSSP